jgi:hypothetical protein
MGKPDCPEKVVPGSYPIEVIEVLFKRSSKRASMLVCLAPDRMSLKPMTIMQRSTAELELFEVGCIPDQLRLASRESGLIDGQLFLD